MGTAAGTQNRTTQKPPGLQRSRTAVRLAGSTGEASSLDEPSKRSWLKTGHTVQFAEARSIDATPKPSSRGRQTLAAPPPGASSQRDTVDDASPRNSGSNSRFQKKEKSVSKIRKRAIKMVSPKRVVQKSFAELRSEYEAKVAPLEVLEAAVALGIDFCHESQYLWIAEEMYHKHLPLGWQRLRDQEEQLFYFNETSGERSWTHPQMDQFLDAVDYQRQAVREGHFANVLARAAESNKNEMEAAKRWKTYFCKEEKGVPGCKAFFWHPEYEESMYEDPKQKVSQNAYLRSRLIEEMQRRLPDIAWVPPPPPSVETPPSVASEDPRQPLGPKEIAVGEIFARLVVKLLKVNQSRKQKVDSSSGLAVERRLCIPDRLDLDDSLRLFSSTPRIRRRAAVTIQRVIRGRRERRQLRGRQAHHAANMRRAAFIQVHVRKWLRGRLEARREERLAQQRLCAALVLQRHWRASKARILEAKRRKQEEAEALEKARKEKAAQDHQRAVRVAMRWWGMLHRVGQLRLERAAKVVQQQARVFQSRVLLRRLKLQDCPVCYKFQIVGGDLNDGRPVWRSQLWMGPESLSSSSLQGIRDSQVAALPNHPGAVNLFRRAPGFGAGFAPLFVVLELARNRRQGQAFIHWHESQRREIARKVSDAVLCTACQRFMREDTAVTRIQAWVRRFLVMTRWRQTLAATFAALHQRRRELERRKPDAALLIQKSWRRHCAKRLVNDIREELYWPLKAWFLYSTSSSSVHVGVRFFPNPRFDAERFAMAGYGPSMASLQDSLWNMENEVGVCAVKTLLSDESAVKTLLPDESSPPWAHPQQQDSTSPVRTDIVTLPCVVGPATPLDIEPTRPAAPSDLGPDQAEIVDIPHSPARVRAPADEMDAGIDTTEMVNAPAAEAVSSHDVQLPAVHVDSTVAAYAAIDKAEKPQTIKIVIDKEFELEPLEIVEAPAEAAAQAEDDSQGDPTAAIDADEDMHARAETVIDAPASVAAQDPETADVVVDPEVQAKAVEVEAENVEIDNLPSGIQAPADELERAADTIELVNAPTSMVVHSNDKQLPAIELDLGIAIDKEAQEHDGTQAPPRKPAWSELANREADAVAAAEKLLQKQDLGSEQKAAKKRPSSRPRSSKRPRSSNKRPESALSGDSSSSTALAAGHPRSPSSGTSGVSRTTSELLLTADASQLVAIATMGRPASAAPKRPISAVRNLDPLVGQGLLLRKEGLENREASYDGYNFDKYCANRWAHSESSLCGSPGNIRTRAGRFYDAARDARKRVFLPAATRAPVGMPPAAMGRAGMSPQLIISKRKSPPRHQQTRASRFYDIRRGVYGPKRSASTGIPCDAGTIRPATAQTKLSSIAPATIRPATAMSGRSSAERSQSGSRGSRPGSQPGSPQGSRPGTRATGSRPGSQPGSPQGSRSGSRAASRPERTKESDIAVLLDKTIDSALSGRSGRSEVNAQLEADALTSKEQLLTHSLRRPQSSISLSTISQVNELSHAMSPHR